MVSLSVSQASREPSAHERVRLSLIRWILHGECNYALWNVLHNVMHNFWQARLALFLEGMFSPFCWWAFARACVLHAFQQCLTWCCQSKGHRLFLSSAVRRHGWLECTVLPCKPLRIDLKLLWLHGGITKTLEGFSVEHSLVHALVCCRSWTKYNKYLTPFLQSDWAHSYCYVVNKSMY